MEKRNGWPCPKVEMEFLPRSVEAGTADLKEYLEPFTKAEESNASACVEAITVKADVKVEAEVLAEKVDIESAVEIAKERVERGSCKDV